jgi:hypothetical protein
MRFNARELPRTAVALAMFAGPLLLLASSLLSPKLKSGAGAQLEVIARDPTRWYWFTLLLLVGSILLVPALLGVAALARTSEPRLGNLGGGLAGLGAVIAVGDVMTQLVSWQMTTPGADRAQMRALLGRFQDAAGANVVFGIGGLALVVGTLVLTAGLLRGRLAPAWAAIGLSVGIVANVLGFSSASNGVVVLSWAIVLIAMGFIGRGALGGARSPTTAARSAHEAPAAAR